MSEIQEFDPMPLLRLVQEFTTTEDKRNRARMTQDLYIDNMPDVQTNGLFLAVIAHGGENSVMTLKVDAVPLEGNMPAGRGIIRVRSQEPDKSITEMRFHVPHGLSTPDDWQTLGNDNLIGEKSISFAAMWGLILHARGEGIYPRPHAVVVTPKKAVSAAADVK